MTMVSFTFPLVILQAFVLVSQTHGICYRDISVQNGRVDYEATHYAVSCDPGYVLNGVRVVYCVRDEWERSPPICSYDHYAARQNVASHRTYDHYSSSGVNGQRVPSLEADNYPCKNLGGCQHICKDVGGRARCRCRQGYTLAPDEKSCIETPSETHEYPQHSRLSNPHRSESVDTARRYPSRNGEDGTRRDVHPCHNHQCAQLCRVEEGRAQCRCDRGYILNKEDQRSCDKNHGPPIHPSNPCENNNGGCDHKCHKVRSSQVVCRCDAGYVLQKDRKSCAAVPSVPRPSSCSFNNGGCDHSCSMRGNHVVCSCPQGYKLATNGKNCVALPLRPRPSPCSSNNGGCQFACSESGDNVVCSCPHGYEIGTDGRSCIALPPRPLRVTCDVDNGGCEYQCSVRSNTIVCSCPSGYRLDRDQKHCVDIDECRSERLNRCHHICENTKGGYTCSCRRGYVMVEDRCEGCRKNSYWSPEKNGCVDCPANSFTLSDGKTSVSDCICNSGFLGSPGGNMPCLDIDDCEIDNFGCSHTCVNTPGGAFCSCPFGYEVDKDNKTCIDIDECSIKNGGCEGLCFNTVGGFYCKCTAGFVSSNKDQYSCDDVDECSENNGGCQQLCINYRGGYYCACEEGYRLDASLNNCSVILCPAFPMPHFSTVRCKKNSQVLPEMDNYPIGTVCNFKCTPGFKDTSKSSRMKCLEDGKWEGSSSQCKSQRCPAMKVPENGNVHPSSCATEGNTVKQKCTFTCRQGYKLVGVSVFSCKNNLSWDKPMTNIPVCQPEDIRASMECTRDITVFLENGTSSHNVTIPEPVTNMDSYQVSPKDTIVGEPTEFKAGVTKVVFTASSPSSNRTAKCVTTVHVIDKEPPMIHSCPDDIVIEDAKVVGKVVTWIEPEPTDNVGVETFSASVEPNTTLTPGSYVVEYIARDAAGNTGRCSFKIDIVRMSCYYLKDPTHGKANCMDWMYGHLCQPFCDDGYMRDPSDAQFYACGDSGVWEPSDRISECLPFTDAVSSECPDGTELKIIEETEEEICLKCPSSATWSPTTKTCEKATTEKDTNITETNMF